MNCLNCNKETSNPKFCSSSCSATLNGKLYPKRRLRHKCSLCSKPIYSYLKLCKACRPITITQDMTLKEAMYSKESLHRSSLFAKVRSRARTVCKSREQKCAHCNYNKHVEVAHIKAISDFNEDTLISIINHPNNLILLCPNCHWEFDNLNGRPEEIRTPINRLEDDYFIR